MAVPEACAVWIEQRLEEELAEQETTGKSIRAIGREVASEIEKYFETKVSPETIKTKALRIKNKGGSFEPAAKRTRKFTKLNMKNQLTEVKKEIRYLNISDEDEKRIADAIAENILTGRSAIRVGTKIETALKKRRKAEGKIYAKPRKVKRALERLKDNTLACEEGLRLLAEGTIKAESEDEKTYIKMIKDALPNIILQAHELGINILSVHDLAIRATKTPTTRRTGPKVIDATYTVNRRPVDEAATSAT